MTEPRPDCPETKWPAPAVQLERNPDHPAIIPESAPDAVDAFLRRLADRGNKLAGQLLERRQARGE